MSRNFETKIYSAHDKFFSEYTYTRFNPDTLVGMFLTRLGIQPSVKLTKMHCTMNSPTMDYISNFEDLVDNKKDYDFITVSIDLKTNKIVGLMRFTVDPASLIWTTELKNITSKSKKRDNIVPNKDWIILVDDLCYEKNIMKIKDVIEFVKESMTLVNKFYSFLVTKYREDKVKMYVCLTIDQVTEFNQTEYRVYLRAGFDPTWRTGRMYYILN